MLASDCKYRNSEIPACNTEQNLRGCDSIICCSICPRVEYCSHVCGSVLFEKENSFSDIIDNLKIIEIELFSFCNRRCSWCPNGSLIDRHTENNFLDIDVLKKLLQELVDYEYGGVFSFSRYNEPFSYFEQFQEYLKIIREYFPYAKFVSNTNGDYLNKEKINLSLIDEISVMDYDCKGQEWCYKQLLDWEVTNIIQYDNYYVGSLNEKQILYYWDWPKSGIISDRGGNLKNYSITERKDPCFEPFHFIGVNYDGTVSPCCNIRNDSLAQKEYVFGDLNNNTLQQILLSNKAKDFKFKIIHGIYDKNMPCFYCNNSGGRYSKSTGSILYE